MDLRQLSPDLAVSPQIAPEDVARLAQEGFRVLINNRPDEEIGPDLDHVVMEDAARAAGIAYHYLPFRPGQVTPELVSEFGRLTQGMGPVIAYCRSGQRCTTLWALSQAGRLSEDQIMTAATEAGYDLTALRPMIASLAQRPG